MNYLLLTIAKKNRQKIISDIADSLTNAGNNVFVICTADENNPPTNSFVKQGSIWYLFVEKGYPVGRISLVKKAIDMILLDAHYKKAIRTACKHLNFDIILYSTPPITLANTIKWCKNQFNAVTYLMLKDIFPQNAVDLGMMKKHGLLAPVYAYFRNKEKILYKASDFIGCMSEANIKYLLKNNPYVKENAVGICVNSYKCEELLEVDTESVRKKYAIPTDATVFLYGGNLGKPQGLSYFVKVLRENANKTDRYFLICGSGSDQSTITGYIEEEKPSNVQYMNNIPADDYDELMRACDVGLVFLDSRFTIPNFPSRILSIMLNAKPILAATDVNTDVGEMIADADAGWWCESTDTAPMNGFIDEICKNPELVIQKGINARNYYESHFTTEITHQQIVDGIQKVRQAAVMC